MALSTVVIAGFTHSSNFPTKNAYQDTYGGSCDLVVLKMDTIDLEIEPIVSEEPTPTDESSITTISLIILAIPIILCIKRKKKKKSL